MCIWVTLVWSNFCIPKSTTIHVERNIFPVIHAISLCWVLITHITVRSINRKEKTNILRLDAWFYNILKTNEKGKVLVSAYVVHKTTSIINRVLDFSLFFHQFAISIWSVSLLFTCSWVVRAGLTGFLWGWTRTLLPGMWRLSLRRGARGDETRALMWLWTLTSHVYYLLWVVTWEKNWFFFTLLTLKYGKELLKNIVNYTKTIIFALQLVHKSNPSIQSTGHIAPGYNYSTALKGQFPVVSDYDNFPVIMIGCTKGCSSCMYDQNLS